MANPRQSAKPQEAPSKAHRAWMLRQFWEFMYQQQLAHQTGDTLALGRAVTCCLLARQPLPRWLGNALLQFFARHVPAAELRRLSAFEIYQIRWQAVRQSRALPPGQKRPLAWTKCWEAAANLLRDTEAAGEPSTIKDSYGLIQKGGGENATLKTCQRTRRRRPG